MRPVAKTSWCVVAAAAVICLLRGAEGDTNDVKTIRQPDSLKVDGTDKFCMSEHCNSKPVTLTADGGFHILESTVKITIDQNDDNYGSLEGGLTFERDEKGGIVKASQVIRTCQAKSDQVCNDVLGTKVCFDSPTPWCGPGRRISVTLSAVACGPTTTWNGATTASDCVCIPGFQFDSSGCSSCPVNTYKSGNGNTACVSCGSGTTSAVASADKSACVCNAGSRLTDGDSPCVPCPVGSYTDAANRWTDCKACPEFSTTSKEGSTSIRECACTSNYFPVPAAGDSFTCKAISLPPAPGAPRVTYRTSSTLTVEWDAVSADNGPITAYEVVATPLGSLAEASHTEKTEGDVHKAVIPGLSPDTRYRVQVLAHTKVGFTEGVTLETYTLFTGCDAGMCGPGQYGPKGTSTCSTCPVGTFQPLCAFDAHCSQCPPGTQTISPGADAASSCVPCRAGTFSAAGSQCTSCAPGAQCPPGSSSPTQGPWDEWGLGTVVARIRVSLSVPMQDSASPTEQAHSSGLDKRYVGAAIAAAFAVFCVVVVALALRSPCGRRCLRRTDVVIESASRDIVVKQNEGHVDIERVNEVGDVTMRVLKNVNMLRAVLTICIFVTIAALWTYTSYDYKENRYVEQHSLNPVSAVTVPRYDGSVLSLAHDPPAPTIELILLGIAEPAADIAAEVAVITAGDGVGTGPETNATRFGCTVQSLASAGLADVERISRPLGEGASMGLGALLSPAEIATCREIGCLYVHATPPKSAQLYGSPIVTVSVKSLRGVPLYAQHARMRLSTPSWKPGVPAWVTYSRPVPGTNGRDSDLSTLGTRSLWIGMMLTRALYTDTDGTALNIGYDMFPSHDVWEEPAPKQSWVSSVRSNGSDYAGPLVVGVRFTVASSVLVVRKLERITVVQFLTSLFSFLGGIIALYGFVAAVLIKTCKSCCKKDFAEDPDAFDARNGAKAPDDDHVTSAGESGASATAFSFLGAVPAMFGGRKASTEIAAGESGRPLLHPVSYD